MVERFRAGDLDDPLAVYDHEVAFALELGRVERGLQAARKRGRAGPH